MFTGATYVYHCSLMFTCLLGIVYLCLPLSTYVYTSYLCLPMIMVALFSINDVDLWSMSLNENSMNLKRKESVEIHNSLFSPYIMVSQSTIVYVVLFPLPL